MKIIIRYYNQWGVLESKIITVSSKVQVKDLKNEIFSETNILTQNQKLTLLDDSSSLEDDIYLSTYKLNEKSVIFVSKLDDAFSDYAGSFCSQFDASVHEETSTLIQLISAQLIKDAQLYLEGIEDKAAMVNSTTETGWNCLHLSAFRGDLENLKWLLSEKGDPRCISKDGWTCLELSVWQQHIHTAEFLLPLSDVNHLSRMGSALMIACQMDDAPMVKLLLTAPVDLSLKYKTMNYLSLAGSQTRILIDEALNERNILLTKQAMDFRVSLCHHRPAKPPIIRGMVKRLAYFKITLIDNYLIIDPDTGLICRFKNSADVPMNPQELIRLETVFECRVSKGLWFQSPDYTYIELQYLNKHMHLAFASKQQARQWYEAIRNCIGYVQYSAKNHQVAVELMLEKANCEIVINQDQTKQRKYSKSILSMSSDESSNVCKVKLRDLQILQFVGKGTYGVVYKCLYKDRIYALKQQPKQANLQYLQSELSVMKQLDHPFIVSLSFAFQTQRNLYLMTDYCQGGDLTNFMTHGHIVSEEVARFICAQLILAIECIHSFGVIYRDLKPENILVSEDNYIKLTDFGLCKEGFNIATTFCGSPAYLSPELLSGNGVTQSTDVYAIGLLLYEMLTGYPPHYTNNISSLLVGIKNEELSLDKIQSKTATSLLKRTLVKNPDQRITLSEMKSHIFFAQIDWKVLHQKKYKAPSLQRIKQSNHYQIQLMDTDYGQNRPDEIYGWDYEKL